MDDHIDVGLIKIIYLVDFEVDDIGVDINDVIV